MQEKEIQNHCDTFITKSMRDPGVWEGNFHLWHSVRCPGGGKILAD